MWAFAQEAGKVTGNALLNQKLLQVRKGEGLLRFSRQYVSVITPQVQAPDRLCCAIGG